MIGVVAVRRYCACMDELDWRIARMFCIGFDGLHVTPEFREFVHRGVSSVILFTRNYQSQEQLGDLCRSIKSLRRPDEPPIMICVDQEGGRVQRFREPFTIIPSMRELGTRGDLDEARRIGSLLARELRAVHIDMNLAPVLDVDSNPANPVIGERSFGSDPNLVARMGCAMIEGLQGGETASGVAACGKHFPGHGDTSVDSHFALPRLAHDVNRLHRVELPPFSAAIEAGVASIMCAHVLFDALDPHLPATMSTAVIHGLLRTDMGFDRVVCSDDLEMKAIISHFGVEEAVVRGAQAGIDLFFVCKDHELQHKAITALCDATRRGLVSHEAIEHANRRLDVLFRRFVRPAHVAATHIHHSPA